MASWRIKSESEIRMKKKRQREKSSSPPPLPPPRSPSFLSASSPIVSVKQEKSVCVRVLSLKYEDEWYSFVYNGSSEGWKPKPKPKRGSIGCGGDRIPVLTPFNVNNVPLCSSCAVVGSTFYCIGGDSERMPGEMVDTVRCFDTSSPEQSWEEACSMLNARVSPRVVVRKGKIYAMGGTTYCDLKSWGEVFSPESNTWIGLPSPSPKQPTAYGLFVAALDDDDNKFIVGSTEDDFLYTYDVETQEWKIFEIKRGYLPTHLKPVAVGTTLFWFKEGELHAYDLLKKSYSSVYIKGLEKVLLLRKMDSNYTPVLLPVDENEFILVCLENVASRDFTLLHCLKICYSAYVVQGDKAILNADVRSSQTFVINTQQMVLDAVLMLRFSAVIKEENICGRNFSSIWKHKELFIKLLVLIHSSRMS